MFRTVPLSIIRSFLLYTHQWYMPYRFADSLRQGSGRNSLSIIIIKPTRCTNFSNLLFGIKLYMFRTVPLSNIRSSFTVHTAMVYVIQVCCVYNEKLLTMDRGTVPKHVKFYSKNKFEKLVHLVGFIIRIYHDERSPECQLQISSVLRFSGHVF
jgi:hypothetical protein